MTLPGIVAWDRPSFGQVEEEVVEQLEHQEVPKLSSRDAAVIEAHRVILDPIPLPNLPRERPCPFCDWSNQHSSYELRE